MSTSTPAEESASHVPRHHDSPNTSAGATHPVLSTLEQATPSPREGRPDASLVSTVLGTTHNTLHRFPSSSSSIPHAHATPSPEALLDAAAASAAPTVLGAEQSRNVLSRLTHATHASPISQTSKPVPDIPQKQPAEASSPTEGPQQRAADSVEQGQAPRSVSSRGGGSGGGRATVTRLYPAVPDAAHPPRPIRVSHVQRRPTGTYADSETAWHSLEDRDTVRLFSDDQFYCCYGRLICPAWVFFSAQ